MFTASFSALIQADIAGARLQRLSFGRVGGFTELTDRDIDGHA